MMESIKTELYPILCSALALVLLKGQPNMQLQYIINRSWMDDNY